MKTLIERELSQEVGKEQSLYGPDPLLIRKQGLRQNNSRDIHEYKSKIKDQRYMNHAINRIAMELMHFLVK